jgi:hypothetical protein
VEPTAPPPLASEPETTEDARTETIAITGAHHDLAIVRRTAAGDREALDELYRTHHRAVARHLRALLGPSAPLADLTKLFTRSRWPWP